MKNEEPQLKAGAISTSEVTILAIAGAGPVMCIGGSLGSILGLTGTGTSLSVAIASLLCVFIGLSYGDLSKKYNCCGGTYAYIASIFGVKPGLFTAFVYYGVMFTTAACPATIFCNYLTSLTGIPGWIGWIIFTILMVSVSWFGVGLSTKATLFVFFVEMILMIIPAVHILTINPSGFVMTTSLTNAFIPGKGANGLLLAVLVWIWAFVGMEAPSFMGEELKDGWKGVKFAVPVSAAFTGIIYVISCWLWTASLTPEQEAILAVSDDALAVYCNLLNYGSGSVMVSLAVLIAALACGMAFYSMMPRFLFDQARKNILPKKVARLNKYQTPVGGVFVYIVLSFLFTMYGLYGYSENGLFDGVNDHFTIMGITATTCYALICIGNVKERWHEKGMRAFMTGKLFPILATLVIFYIIFFTSGTKYIVITLVWYLVAAILAFALQKKVDVAAIRE